MEEEKNKINEKGPSNSQENKKDEQPQRKGWMDLLIF